VDDISYTSALCLSYILDTGFMFLDVLNVGY